jgi:hypothetical protein
MLDSNALVRRTRTVSEVYLEPKQWLSEPNDHDDDDPPATTGPPPGGARPDGTRLRVL